MGKMNTTDDLIINLDLNDYWADSNMIGSY